MAAGIPDTQPERLASRALPPPRQDEGRGRASIDVVITRRSCRLLDKDNLFGGVKPLCDQLRALKLIPEDNPEAINLEVFQVKVSSKAEEGTEIEINHRLQSTKV